MDRFSGFDDRHVAAAVILTCDWMEQGEVDGREHTANTRALYDEAVRRFAAPVAALAGVDAQVSRIVTNGRAMHIYWQDAEDFGYDPASCSVRAAAEMLSRELVQ